MMRVSQVLSAFAAVCVVGALGCSENPSAGGQGGGSGSGTPPADGAAGSTPPPADGAAGSTPPPASDGAAGSTPPPADASGQGTLPPGARALTANDVSVLFPLNAATSLATLWPATLEGRGGPLLPVPTYALMKRPLNAIGGPIDAAKEHSGLRVVGVRFDPCFGDGVCQPQVRLVLQLIAANGLVLDGAVHALYNLTPVEFRALLGELRALTALAPQNQGNLPLGPSPALAAQGSGGAYGTALRALVTRYAGAGNLARMTFMTREGSRSGQWVFGGFNVRSFTPEGEIEIPGLPAGSRSQAVGADISSEYGYVVTPAPVRLQALLAVITAQKASTASPEARTAGYAALAKVENPTLESPDTADCASCHIANRVRGYLDERHPEAVTPAMVYAGQASAPRNVGGAEKDAGNLRAFGYMNGYMISDPVVSQRTANETHRVLQLLAAM